MEHSISIEATIFSDKFEYPCTKNIFPPKEKIMRAPKAPVGLILVQEIGWVEALLRRITPSPPFKIMLNNIGARIFGSTQLDANLERMHPLSRIFQTKVWIISRASKENHAGVIIEIIRDACQMVHGGSIEQSLDLNITNRELAYKSL